MSLKTSDLQMTGFDNATMLTPFIGGPFGMALVVSALAAVCHRASGRQSLFRLAQAVVIYSRIALCSYSHSASRCLTKSPIDTRPTSLSWQMTGRWRNRPLVIFSMAT
jgi:hypothetical protein